MSALQLSGLSARERNRAKRKAKQMARRTSKDKERRYAGVRRFSVLPFSYLFKAAHKVALKCWKREYVLQILAQYSMRMYFLCYNVHCRLSSLRVCYRTECFFDVVEGHTSQCTFSLICGGHYNNYYLYKIFTTVCFYYFTA